MATIIDGKQVAKDSRANLAKEIAEFSQNTGIVPGLAAVLVGGDPASEIYVRNKRKACTEVGIHSEEHKLSEETTTEELVALVEDLNRDKKIHGILVQLPLPKHINVTRVLRTVSPLKDVDGFHHSNVGLLVEGNPRFVPCTPPRNHSNARHL